MIKVTLTNELGLAQELGGTPKMIRQAVNSAILRTTRQLERDLEAASSKELDIPKRVLAKYRIKSKRLQNGTGLVWYGYNPIKAKYVAEMPPSGKNYGTARQEDFGVTVRSYIFQGSFLAKMRNGKRGVWNRGPGGRTNLIEQKVSILRAPFLSQQIKARVESMHAENIRHEIEKRLKRK